MSRDVYKECIELLAQKKVSHRHSLFQLKHFILGKEPTIQAKLRKCLNEIDARKISIKNMKLALEEAEDDGKLLEIKIRSLGQKATKSDLHTEYRDIQIRKLKRKQEANYDTIRTIRQKLRECEEETAFLLSAFYELEKAEPLADFDDFAKNQEFWNEHYSQELQLRLLLQKPLDLELVKCILALDKTTPIRTEVISILEQLQSRAMKDKRHAEEMNQSIESARLKSSYGDNIKMDDRQQES